MLRVVLPVVGPPCSMGWAQVCSDFVSVRIWIIGKLIISCSTVQRHLASRSGPVRPDRSRNAGLSLRANSTTRECSILLPADFAVRAPSLPPNLVSGKAPDCRFLGKFTSCCPAPGRKLYQRGSTSAHLKIPISEKLHRIPVAAAGTIWRRNGLSKGLRAGKSAQFELGR